jgi:hypothetical protein
MISQQHAACGSAFQVNIMKIKTIIFPKHSAIANQQDSNLRAGILRPEPLLSSGLFASNG